MKYSFLGIISFVAYASAAIDPLPSWNEGNAKKAILEFINTTTSKESPDYIPLEERVATFDQDGTLWVEQPIYTQFQFAIDRVKSLADKHPEWKSEEPYKSILSNDIEAVKKFTFKDIEKVIAATHAGITVDEFREKVHAWLQKAVHPRFKKSYTELIYQPMLEVIDLFRKNGFKTYIVSGGGQEFIRVFSDKVYGVSVENVIGSAGKVKYEYRDGDPALLKLPEVLFIDDKAGKPEAIYLIIGKSPVAAFGNSDGDRQMLEWTQKGKGKRLELLVHHDDQEREYAYGPDSKVGTFSDSLMDEAIKNKWIVVSMKNDWKVIFPEK